MHKKEKINILKYNELTKRENILLKTKEKEGIINIQTKTKTKINERGVAR